MLALAYNKINRYTGLQEVKQPCQESTHIKKLKKLQLHFSPKMVTREPQPGKSQRKQASRIFYRDADEHPEIIDMVREIPFKVCKPISVYLHKIEPNLSEQTVDLLAFQLYNAYLGLVLQTSFIGKESIPFPIKEYHDSHAKIYARVFMEKEGRE